MIARGIAGRREREEGGGRENRMIDGEGEDEQKERMGSNKAGITSGEGGGLWEQLG